MGAFEARELSVRWPGGSLRGISLYVTSGELVGLLGDAGGSALLRTMAGVVGPASGVVRVDGEDVTGVPASAVAAHGIVLVPAGRGVPAALTVRECLRLGAALAPGCGAGAGAARGERADRVLGWFPRLGGLVERVAGSLPPADAGLLALAVALARAPRLLLVDGLLPSVGPDGYPDALAALRAAVAEGASVVVAEAVDPAEPAVDPAAFDRAFLVGNETLRPWYAAARDLTAPLPGEITATP